MATQKQAGSGARGTGRPGGTGAAAKTSAGRTGSAAKTAAGGTGSAAKAAAGNARPAQGKPAQGKPAQGKPAQGKPGLAKPGQVKPGPNGKAAAAGSSVQPDSPAGSFWRRIVGYAAAHKLEFSTLLISLLGLGVSVYLTVEHYTSNSYAGCSATAGAISCAKVTTSPQSIVVGVPVAVLGLAFYVFMVAVNTPWGWRARQPVVHWARLASVIVGICFVLYLVWAELFAIGAICLYCTSVHVLTFLLFALIVARATLTGLRPSPARS